MTDLDLVLPPMEHSPARPPHRRRRPRRSRQGLVLLVALALIAAVVGGGVLGVRKLVSAVSPGPADYPGPGSGSAVVQVHPGDSAADIGDALTRAGVVKSVKAFRRAAAADPDSLALQPGFYRLRKQMTSTAALALMLDPSAAVRSRVVVPEGSRQATVLALVRKGTAISAASLQAGLRDPQVLRLPAYAKGRPEGFLFPATYSFGPDTTGAQALAQMVQRFDQAAGAVRLEAGAKALGRTPYDVLTVASLVQAEAKLPADYPKVARVVYNRLAQHKDLELDSTINYVLPQRKGHLSSKDLRFRSPYNMYTHAGLPPTPINSPGELAMKAALHPAAGPWIWFLTVDKAGHTAFTDSYTRFLQLKQQTVKLRTAG